MEGTRTVTDRLRSPLNYFGESRYSEGRCL